MKIELIRQKFNDTREYKYKPFTYCCEKIKDNPCIMFSDEVETDDREDDYDEYTFPAFALWQSETDYAWGNSFINDNYYKINYCPFCGEPIKISVVDEEDVDDIYKSISKQREELWNKYNKTDSKKRAEMLYKQVHELDNQIDWLYSLCEYKDIKNEFGVDNFANNP